MLTTVGEVDEQCRIGWSQLLCWMGSVLDKRVCGTWQASEELQLSAVGLYDQDTGPFPLSEVQVGKCIPCDRFANQCSQLQKDNSTGATPGG